MKIINIDNKPFEWTFNGEPFGPMQPGQILDLPDEVAMHAIKRSVVLDDTGDFVGLRVDMLSNVPKEKIKDIALFECPYTLMGSCHDGPFKSDAELRAHLQSHWKAEPLAGKGKGAQSAQLEAL